MTDRIPLDAMTSDALDQLYAERDRGEAAIARVQALADRWVKAGPPLGVSMARWWDMRLAELLAAVAEPSPAATQATEEPHGFRPFTPAHIPKTGNPATVLVVEPYRADDGSRKWVFRCWGTDTCDGWLSLDHYSQQSAERARDRHVAEEHTAPEPA